MALDKIDEVITSGRPDIPDKVSWRVVDAWAAIPPCNPASAHPYCHVQCPYFYECYPEDYEEDDEYDGA